MHIWNTNIRKEKNADKETYEKFTFLRLFRQLCNNTLRVTHLKNVNRIYERHINIHGDESTARMRTNEPKHVRLCVCVLYMLIVQIIPEPERIGVHIEQMKRNYGKSFKQLVISICHHRHRHI